MEEIISKSFCAHCGAEQIENYKFCSQCGKRNQLSINKEKKRIKSIDKNLGFLLGYTFFIILLILTASLTEETYKTIVVTSIIFAIVDLAFAFPQPKVWQLLVFPDIKIKPLLAIIGISLFTGVTVSFSMEQLNLFLFDETNVIMPYFEHLEHPLLMGIIFIAVFPAIFEELAFRGFIYNNLKTLSGDKAAIWGSTFLFAIVHFSLLSLIWLIPFALLLSYFRKKHSTIIYGIIGHFIHNATTLIIEYLGWF